MKKKSAFTLRSGNRPAFKNMGKKEKAGDKTANSKSNDKKGKFGKFMGKYGCDIISAIGDALPKYN